MSILYVEESSATIGKTSNRITVKYKDGMERSIPIETVDSITILGHAQLTTQCVQECLTRGIPVMFFSKNGSYFGRLQSTGHVNTNRQRMQCRHYDTDFSLQLSKIIVSAKLKNQKVVLKRYERSAEKDVSAEVNMISICRNKIDACETINEIIGFEGQGAKAYFKGLSKLIKKDFSFNGRNRQPPRDEFNSMLSLGYSILLNEIYGKIEEKGLNPYFGFLHRDREKHPTLASDLLEEWRSVIVDSLVMSLINGNEIAKEDFVFDYDNPSCFLTKNGLNIFLKKLDNKLKTKVQYLKYIDYEVSFRHAISLQIEQLVKAIEEEDADAYMPLEIR